MERVVERDNARAALKRVRKNGGSPGVDGMTVDELPTYLREHWPTVRAHLLAGTYRPAAVRRHAIAKSDGGMRELGIPTGLDRFVQQCILQVLQPRFDPTFSDHSHGFRPGRRAHDALCAAQKYVQEGRRWVVDIDLESFFDRVSHDVLMGKLAARLADKRLLRVIRRFLEAGMMAEGIVTERRQGTPQGGPLSPLLANVLLDEVDKALEERGHAFARYADDCNVYVWSKRAGERVMESLQRLYSKLRLRINTTKSAVALATTRRFLGHQLWRGANGVSWKVAPKTLEAMKDRVRELTNRNRGRSLDLMIAELRSYLVGWGNYFHLVSTRNVFAKIDGWIRRRLRMAQLKQWKRGSTAYRKLVARGASVADAQRTAGHLRRWWTVSNWHAINAALSPAKLGRMGLPALADQPQPTNRRIRTRTSGGVGGAGRG